jgi:integrase
MEVLVATLNFTRQFVARVITGKEGVAGTWSDSESPLGLKRTASGGCSYRVVARVDGRVRTFSPKSDSGAALKNSAKVLTLDEARTWARTLVAKVTLGKPPQPEKRAVVIGLQDYLEQTHLPAYTEERSPRTGEFRRPATIKAERHGARWAGQILGNIPLDTITAEDVHRLEHHIGDPASIRLAHGVLARALDHAVRVGLVPFNVARSVRLAVRPPRRNGHLSLDELGTLWYVAGDMGTVGGRLAQLLIAMPLRRQEAATLQRRDVDLGERLLTIREERAKNRMEHRLPMTKQAADLLGAIQGAEAAPEDLIFPAPRSGLPFSAFSDLVKRLHRYSGIPGDWSLHTFRKSITTALGEHADVDEAAIDRWLCHSRVGVASVYQMAKKTRAMREVANAWSDLLNEVIVKGATS